MAEQQNKEYYESLKIINERQITTFAWSILENIIMFLMSVLFAIYIAKWLFWIPLLFINFVKSPNLTLKKDYELTVLNKHNKDSKDKK